MIKTNRNPAKKKGRAPQVICSLISIVPGIRLHTRAKTTALKKSFSVDTRLKKTEGCNRISANIFTKLMVKPEILIPETTMLKKYKSLCTYKIFPIDAI